MRSGTELSQFLRIFLTNSGITRMNNQFSLNLNYIGLIISISMVNNTEGYFIS